MLHKNIWLLIFLFFPSFLLPRTILCQENQCKTIKIAINKNVELFGLMLQLDNGEGLELNNDSTLINNRKVALKDWYSLALINYEKYKAFENSEVMQFYRELGKKGISDVFIVGFLLQVNEVPNAKINLRTDKEFIYGFLKSYDTTEAVNTANTFLSLLNKFYSEINFENHLQQNKTAMVPL